MCSQNTIPAAIPINKEKLLAIKNDLVTTGSLANTNAMLCKVLHSFIGRVLDFSLFNTLL
jgi:hypothetical protein